MEKIELKINGRQKALEIEQDWSLLYIIREVLGLTGTKCGCGEGNCGTCTVIMNGKAVRSCKVKGNTLNGAEILTIEGVADGEELHPIQKAFIEAGAVQCGFCTPGMIMRAKALIDQNPDPTEQEVRQALAGHICRCGGFEKIVEAILNAAREMRGETCGEKRIQGNRKESADQRCGFQGDRKKSICRGYEASGNALRKSII